MDGKFSEKYLESRLRELINQAGGWCLKWTSPGTDGVPDRIVFLPGGRMFLVELKSTGKTQRPTQKYVGRKLSELGHPVFIIDDLDKLYFFVEEICGIPLTNIRR